MVEFTGLFNGTGLADGQRGEVASFNLDRAISDRLESRRISLRRELELTAKKAGKATTEILSTQISFTQNVNDAFGVLVAQMRDYMRYSDAQIKSIRQFLTLETDKLSKIESVVPASIAADALAVLGGAVYNPSSYEVPRDDFGGYLVDGATSYGMLYLSRKVIDLFSQDYKDLFGFAPQFKYRWVHLTPRPRALEAHAQLNGAVFTSATASQVLKNNTVYWLGPWFSVRDHIGCRCIILMSLS